MSDQELGARRFGQVNWIGVQTLVEREIRRFMSVWTQTLLAPLVTAGLFMMIFTLAIGPQRGDVMGVPFVTFLAPGILTMTMIQNAFANSSSSIMVAKAQGNIVDTLMPPLSGSELTFGYLMGAVMRGLAVGLTIALAMGLFMGIWPAHPVVALIFVLMGSALMGGLGVITALYAQKFDQMAAITNFVVTPLAFLSGTFYSVQTLPPVLAALTHINPIFYLIDGARYGIIGVSDSSPWLGGAVCLATTAAVVGVARWMLTTGYRLKP